MSSLDTGSSLPKYYQLKQIIRDLIEEEELREGDPIPPERKFCEQYGVSRMTTRQAIVELVNQGILYREQGKGTFVAGKKVKQEAERLTSFTEDMARRGMEAMSRTLEVGLAEAGPMAARLLNIDDGEKLLRVQYVRHADGVPMALETSYLLREVAEDLPGLASSNCSVYDELRRSGINIDRAEQSYKAKIINEVEAKHLGVEIGSPALLLERVSYDDTDRAFEYAKSTYRGDR